MRLVHSCSSSFSCDDSCCRSRSSCLDWASYLSLFILSCLFSESIFLSSASKRWIYSCVPCLLYVICCSKSLTLYLDSDMSFSNPPSYPSANSFYFLPFFLSSSAMLTFCFKSSLITSSACVSSTFLSSLSSYSPPRIAFSVSFSRFVAAISLCSSLSFFSSSNICVRWSDLKRLSWLYFYSNYRFFWDISCRALAFCCLIDTLSLFSVWEFLFKASD